MEPTFWHNKWQSNEIGFHEPEANSLLVKHFPKLALTKGRRIFLPLCGKTLDIGWLLGGGYQVVGIELSPLAIEQLFEELAITPDITSMGALTKYSAPDIDIFAGDFFNLATSELGTVDAIYDRAALIALPETTRHRYTQHLMEISLHAPQLLITLEYNQDELQGPPFSLSGEEIQRHYSRHYKISRVENEDVEGGLKGKCAAVETVWLLTAD